MLSTEEFTSVIERIKFESEEVAMTPVSLNNIFQASEEEGEELTLNRPSKMTTIGFTAKPPQQKVVSIDATSMTLGSGENAVAGAVRGSVVEENSRGVGFKIQNYGPYLICYSNRNRDEAYNQLRSTVFGVQTRTNAPSLAKMIDRTRNFLEKHLQLEIARNYRESLLLFDGSLTINPIDSPKKHFEQLVSAASQNSNDIVSVSKHTTLTLEGTKESILSPLEGVVGPCYCNVKRYLSSKPSRYRPIDIYAVKLSRNGEPFRIDIPVNSPKDPEELLAETAALTDAFGYPEGLRVAHIACIFSSLEILELQAAAVRKYNLELREDIRERIFGPWG